MFGKKKIHYSDEDIRKLVKDSSLRHIAFIMDETDVGRPHALFRVKRGM